jgi:hypothetical protein
MCARNNRKDIARSVFYVVRAIPIARQRIAKHIPAEANTQNNRTFIARERPQYAGYNRITSVVMQHTVNTTIHEDVFSIGPAEDYTYLDRCTPVRDLHLAFKIPYVYGYITKLCRRQAEVILNHENPNVLSIGQGEARHRKHKRLKLGGGQVYDRSSV